MAKHTRTIRQQIADKLFECVSPFCEIGAQRVNINPLQLGVAFLYPLKTSDRGYRKVKSGCNQLSEFKRFN